MASEALNNTENKSPLREYSDRIQEELKAKRGDTDATKLSQQYTDFLRLLTAQLQNQDPLDPMDSHEFTNQLVLFSGVEQQVKQGESLAALLKTQEEAGQSLQSLLQKTEYGSASDATQFIGKHIDASGSNIALQDGSAKVWYDLDADMSRVFAVIKNEQDAVVNTLDLGEGSSGSSNFTWNGQSAQGVKQEDGLYKVELRGIDENGQAVTLPLTFERQKVIGVEVTKNGALLLTEFNRFFTKDVSKIWE